MAQDSSAYSSLAFHYAYQIPQADLKDRFLNSSCLGATYQYTSSKKWTWSFSGNFMFRDTIRENSILDGLKTSSGYIIDGNGELADIFLFQRGYYVSFSVGKHIFPFKNKQISLALSVGVGFLEHKILIQDGDFKVQQLTAPYKKGYDRLTNGILVQENISLFYNPKGRSIAFSFGIEAIQAFTQNRRSYNFDTMQKDTKKRIDALIGPKIGMVIMFKKTSPDPYYFR